MSEMRTVPPRAFPVELNGLTFYAVSWNLTGKRLFTEQGTVTGGNFVTNTSRRSKRLELKGYFVFLTALSEILLPLDNAVQEKLLFQFDLRDVHFADARLSGYVLSEEGGKGILPCSLTIVVSENLSQAVPETDTESGTEGTT